MWLGREMEQNGREAAEHRIVGDIRNMPQATPADHEIRVSYFDRGKLRRRLQKN